MSPRTSTDTSWREKVLAVSTALQDGRLNAGHFIFRARKEGGIALQIIFSDVHVSIPLDFYRQHPLSALRDVATSLFPVEMHSEIRGRNEAFGPDSLGIFAEEAFWASAGTLVTGKPTYAYEKARALLEEVYQGLSYRRAIGRPREGMIDVEAIAEDFPELFDRLERAHQSFVPDSPDHSDPILGHALHEEIPVTFYALEDASRGEELIARLQETAFGRIGPLLATQKHGVIIPFIGDFYGLVEARKEGDKGRPRLVVKQLSDEEVRAKMGLVQLKAPDGQPYSMNWHSLRGVVGRLAILPGDFSWLEVTHNGSQEPVSSLEDLLRPILTGDPLSVRKTRLESKAAGAPSIKSIHAVHDTETGEEFVVMPLRDSHVEVDFTLIDRDGRVVSHDFSEFLERSGAFPDVRYQPGFLSSPGLENVTEGQQVQGIQRRVHFQGVRTTDDTFFFLPLDSQSAHFPHGHHGISFRMTVHEPASLRLIELWGEHKKVRESGGDASVTRLGQWKASGEIHGRVEAFLYELGRNLRRMADANLFMFPNGAPAHSETERRFGAHFEITTTTVHGAQGVVGLMGMGEAYRHLLNNDSMDGRLADLAEYGYPGTLDFSLKIHLILLGQFFGEMSQAGLLDPSALSSADWFRAFLMGFAHYGRDEKKAFQDGMERAKAYRQVASRLFGSVEGDNEYRDNFREFNLSFWDRERDQVDHRVPSPHFPPPDVLRMSFKNPGEESGQRVFQIDVADNAELDDFLATFDFLAGCRRPSDALEQVRQSLFERRPFRETGDRQGTLFWPYHQLRERVSPAKIVRVFAGAYSNFVDWKNLQKGLKAAETWEAFQGIFEKVWNSHWTAASRGPDPEDFELRDLFMALCRACMTQSATVSMGGCDLPLEAAVERYNRLIQKIWEPSYAMRFSQFEGVPEDGVVTNKMDIVARHWRSLCPVTDLSPELIGALGAAYFDLPARAQKGATPQVEQAVADGVLVVPADDGNQVHWNRLQETHSLRLKTRLPEDEEYVVIHVNTMSVFENRPLGFPRELPINGRALNQGGVSVHSPTAATHNSSRFLGDLFFVVSRRAYLQRGLEAIVKPKGNHSS